uniref:Uncharacterized protein n=1 Tax=Arundo donax TaxID=35708 RepID=A0A0A9E3A2_ARUDO
MSGFFPDEFLLRLHIDVLPWSRHTVWCYWLSRVNPFCKENLQKYQM